MKTRETRETYRAIPGPAVNSPLLVESNRGLQLQHVTVDKSPGLELVRREEPRESPASADFDLLHLEFLPSTRSLHHSKRNSLNLFAAVHQIDANGLRVLLTAWL